MNYHESIQYLYGLTNHGIKLGLENIRRILQALGNPERSFRAVHIAGTNGKGSTSAMLASILQEAGYVTGLFTSPHLVRFTERIRINFQEIPEDDVVSLTSHIKEVISSIAGLKPTFFEFVTALCFEYFRQRGVQWAVIETGMGGRFDATNTLQPDLTIITPVAMDHKEFLGNTLSEIAFEKAGIIKQAVPVVLAPQQNEALNTLTSVAEEKGSTVILYGKEFRADSVDTRPERTAFDYLSPEAKIHNLYVPLPGTYQAVNAAVAIRAAEEIIGNSNNFTGIIKRGLSRTEWPGRLERKNWEGKTFLLDGAHNPEAIRSMTDTLKSLFKKASGENQRRIIIILGVMSDKDTEGILHPVVETADILILTAPRYSRSARPETLKETAERIIQNHRQTIQTRSLLVSPDISEAIEQALKIHNDDDIIVITGSFYTVGEAKTIMGEKEHLSDLREKR